MSWGWFTWKFSCGSWNGPKPILETGQRQLHGQYVARNGCKKSQLTNLPFFKTFGSCFFWLLEDHRQTESYGPKTTLFAQIMWPRGCNETCTCWTQSRAKHWGHELEMDRWNQNLQQYLLLMIHFRGIFFFLSSQVRYFLVICSGTYSSIFNFLEDSDFHQWCYNKTLNQNFGWSI